MCSTDCFATAVDYFRLNENYILAFRLRYFGGDLEIENHPGQGCSVVVTLNQLGECKERVV